MVVTRVGVTIFITMRPNIGTATLTTTVSMVPVGVSSARVPTTGPQLDNPLHFLSFLVCSF